MNLITKFLVLHGLASPKTKKDLGFEIMCKVEKLLPLPIDRVEEKQIVAFKAIVTKTISTAEQICLKAHLEEMIDVYTVDGHVVRSEEVYFDRHRHAYEEYANALSSVMDLS